MTDIGPKTWFRVVGVAALVTWAVYLVLFAINGLLRLPADRIRGEIWILFGGMISGVILAGRVARPWAALVGIAAAPVVAMAIGFAWIARRFQEARLTANLVGLAYIGAIAAIGAAGGLGLGLLLRRVAARRRRSGMVGPAAK